MSYNILTGDEGFHLLMERCLKRVGILILCLCGLSAVSYDYLTVDERETVQKGSAISYEQNLSRIYVPEFEIPVPVENVPKVKKKETAKQAEVAEAAFVVKGKLRSDYCIGSTIDLSELRVLLGTETIALDECEIIGMDTSKEGNYELVVSYKNDSVKIPYGVVEYKAVLHGIGEEEIIASMVDYRLDPELEEPIRMGKVFTGWYRDEECTIPFVSAEQGELTVDLYASWGTFTNYECDESGYITAYTGSVLDGLLHLPAHESCIGVRSFAFANVTDIVTDIYIPANIIDIESGAFDALPFVFYIYVEPDNPVYCSIDGVLYTKDGSEIVVYPGGR